METQIFESTKEIKRAKKELEEKLRVTIEIVGHKVAFEGDAVDEYEAALVLDAINFGFSATKALQLKEPDVLIRKINIGDFTRRKDKDDVRGRIIGTNGKTKKTVEEITNCDIIVREGEVGIIGSAESIDEATTAITNIIRGSKQSNAYSYLERRNREKKEIEEGLGIVEPKNPKPKDKNKKRLKE